VKKSKPTRRRRTIGTAFVDPLGNLFTEEDEGENPNLEIFEMQILDLWETGGESGNGECERGSGEVSHDLDLGAEAEENPE
jgi:hypothetical protein